MELPHIAMNEGEIRTCVQPLCARHFSHGCVGAQQHGSSLSSQSCPGPFSGLTWPGGPKCTEAMCILTSEHFRAPHNPACTGPVFNPVRTPNRPGDCLALPGSTLSRDAKRQRHGAARSLATTFLLWFSAPGSPDITHAVWQPGNVCRRGQAPMARAGLQFRYTTFF